MVVPKVHLERSVHSLADVSSGNRKHTLGKRVNLLHASVGAGGSQPAFRAALVVGDFSGKLAHLEDGWIRSPPSPASSGMLSWDGRIPTPSDTEWEVVLLWRNDTGAAVDVVFVHIEEDI